MATGPNQILIKRSDIASNEPSGLPHGEIAINTADGKLFFTEQTSGVTSGDTWKFHGFTNEGFVRSVNGQTGDVTVTGGGGGGALDAIEGNDGTVVTGATAIKFDSATDGITFSVTLSGNTATVSIDATDAISRGQGGIEYTYSVTSGAFNYPSASANGEFIYNPDVNILLGNNLSIYKSGNGGVDFRDVLVAFSQDSLGKVGFVVGSGTNQNFLYCESISYDAVNGRLNAKVYETYPTSVTGGNGKTITVFTYPSEVPPSSPRLPSGETFGTVVTSFNGETGDVIGVSSINGYTGDVTISSLSIGYTAGNTAPSSANTGDFWYENDTGLYYAYVWDGSTLGWLQISGQDGIDGATGPAGADGRSVGYTAGNTFPSGSATGDFFFESDTGLYYANVWDGSTLAWVQISGRDGATGATGPVGDYVETFNGLTGTVDTSALTLHVAGISSDGGITASRLISTDAGSQSAGSVVVGGIHHIFSNGSNLQFAPNGFSKFSMSGSEVGAFAPFKAYSTSILSGKVNTQAGISMDTAGITFPDGTYQDTATITSSYSGHIYSPSEGTYYLDPRVPTGRTITEFYAICATGGITAELQNSGSSVATIAVTPTGATASLSNTSLAEGGTLEMVTTGYNACYDFRFAVRYTQ